MAPSAALRVAGGADELAVDVTAVWQCESCGKCSNAKAKPRSHVRGGNLHCGPFQPVQIAADGMVLAPAGATVVEHHTPQRPTTYRQSLLRSFEICPRRALHELLIPGDMSVGNVGSSADLGSATHAVFGEILATLRRQGEKLISTQEGVEIMYETLTTGEWVLPAEDRDTLRDFVLSFCSSPKYRLEPSRIMALETRLTLDIGCPDGVTRTLTGQPDVILSDPPDALVVIDWKTGRGKPPSPRQMPEEGEPIVGRQYLSEGGTYQLDIYGLLALKGRTADGYQIAPRAQRVTLREAWMRFGERREATLGIEELEHVEREIAVQMMLLDRAIDEGPDSGSKLTNPRPGRQCNRGCPVSLSCPVPEEQRGEGAITSPDDADENARRWVKVRAADTALRARLKAWHEDTGHCPDVGDGTVVRWEGERGSRKFGAHPPAVPDVERVAAVAQSDEDFVAAMEAELARQRDGAGAAA